MAKVQPAPRTGGRRKARFFGARFGTNINQDDVDRP